MNAREFAIEVVKTLQAAGYQALWAGGCVRDQLVGRTPKDYDVATNATPDQVREVFGNKRTLPIGASFGVITVLGPKTADPIEVATFRRDGGYSDGRRPDAIEFTDAREDAIRRDFTINGMFFDPLKEQVLDYVGGQEDLVARQIRAIGNPHERINEDKLRMLRGIRFASTFDFELEEQTLEAIRQHANEITVVSGERIGAEMRRMLAGSNRAVAAKLLRASGLLKEILPDGDSLYRDESQWDHTLGCLNRLLLNDFGSAASILLEPIVKMHGITPIFERWKLSNDERKSIEWVCKHWESLDRAADSPWSVIQPLMLKQDIDRALAVADSQSETSSEGVVFCRQRLEWPREKLDPPLILDGKGLIAMGVKPNPQFKSVLDSVRAAQLDDEIATPEEAVALAKQMLGQL
ncbi:MAG: CCA tRNA nucleotidyltransferase [Mariniblastus sp.]